MNKDPVTASPDFIDNAGTQMWKGRGSLQLSLCVD